MYLHNQTACKETKQELNDQRTLADQVWGDSHNKVKIIEHIRNHNLKRPRLQMAQGNTLTIVNYSTYIWSVNICLVMDSPCCYGNWESVSVLAFQ